MTEVTNADGSITTTHPDGSRTVLGDAPPSLGWYCPACGLRFAAAGTDDTGHPPVDLLPLGAVPQEPVAAVPQVGPLAEVPEQRTLTLGNPEGAAAATPNLDQVKSLLTSVRDTVGHALDTLARL